MGEGGGCRGVENATNVQIVGFLKTNESKIKKKKMRNTHIGLEAEVTGIYNSEISTCLTF